jgi:L-lactate dehydrogenase complex protein LldG
VAWRDTPGFEALYNTDVGITDVQAAIAETGSLVCTAGPGSARGLSLVPPIHIAIVRRSQVVPDLIDYWTPSLNAQLPPSSSVALITGPSKTADIEGVLITGVHGPREVHILLIEDA